MRGCEKRVVFLRHPDSTLFEEAYFVVKRDATAAPAPVDMVAEAERILLGEGRPEEEKSSRSTQEKSKRNAFWRWLLCFFAGGGACAVGLWLCGAL
jgi:hypothetical protein